MMNRNVWLTNVVKPHLGTTHTAVEIGVWRGDYSDSIVRALEPEQFYGVDPYENYYEESYVFFPLENEDDRIHPKTVIFGIEIDGVYKAYKERDLDKGDIKDEVNGVKLTVAKDNTGIVKIIDEEGNEIVKERGFWFSWYAFHPDTLLYE